MKRLVLVVVAFFWGGLLLGQEAPPRDPIGEQLFPPDLVMANQRAIGLDDGQKAYLRGEVLKAQTRFTEMQWQLQDAMEALANLLKQNSAEEAKILEQLDKVLSTEREIKRTQIGLMVRIKNKLTTEQQSKLRQIRAEGKPRPQ